MEAYCGKTTKFDNVDSTTQIVVRLKYAPSDITQIDRVIL